MLTEYAFQAVSTFGSSCHLPGSFQNPIVDALYAPDYVEAVRTSILAAGDQASRSMVVGALMAAADDPKASASGIPASWRGKVTKLPEIEALVDELLKKRFAER